MMQRKTDSSAGYGSPVNQPDIYCGAFAYTSPPDKLMQSDNIN